MPSPADDPPIFIFYSLIREIGLSGIQVVQVLLKFVGVPGINHTQAAIIESYTSNYICTKLKRERTCNTLFGLTVYMRTLHY